MGCSDCSRLQGETVFRVSVDPSIECGSLQHIIQICVSGVLILGMLVACVFLARNIRANCIYADTRQHDR